MTRPTFVYDGDCGICRIWVNYWKALTGERVVYRPYQEAAADFRDIPREDFARAVKLIEPGGRVYSGAAATFRLLRDVPGRGAWWRLYTSLPGFAPASERAYAFFAHRRGLLSRVTRLLWGRAPEPERYELTSFLFLRLLGAIYVAAFASLAVQVTGLIGRDGILPLGDYLETAYEALGSGAYRALPSLFWLGSSDTALVAGAIVGAALGALVMLDVWTRPALIGAFALYLSYVHAGQDFMSFQWDLLLLEAGFLAIFLTGGSRIVVWLYRWLAFRYFFLAGAAKLLSSEPSWRDLTALEYHFWTQPLPTPLAWYAAQLPPWLLAAGTAATLVFEVAAVFLIFLPRLPRAFAAVCLIVFQALIVLTGNYNFFNLLSVAICVFLFDDAALRRIASPRIEAWARQRAPRPGRTATALATALALLVAPAGIARIWEAFARAELPVAGALAELVSPLLIVNPYGLFAVMTTARPEIVIEGSADGETWREYVFRYKPGPVTRPPSWNVPHQPRLDWQMWFAALSDAQANPWFASLMLRLLHGSAPVLSLLASNPFPDRPPSYVRATLYEYRFSDRRFRAATGQWWVRRSLRPYFPQVRTSDFRKAALAPGADEYSRIVAFAFAAFSGSTR